MNDDKLREMSVSQILAAMSSAAASVGGSYIPQAADYSRIRRLCDAANKNRCTKCLCKIPPGKAGRKCKVCRDWTYANDKREKA